MERAFLNYTLRAASQNGLSVKWCTVRKFASLFPDQCSWLSHLRVSEDETVAHFFKRLEYTDLPEYCTMWLCIILCSPVMNTDVAWLEAHEQELLDALVEYRKSTGLVPHPSTVLKIVQCQSGRG